MSSTLTRLQTLYHTICPRLGVTRKLAGLRCRININDHLQWLVLSESKTVEGATRDIVTRSWGRVWDVGSNFGLYSLLAAKAGNHVVAFDMSPSVLALLDESCRLNKLSVTTVPRALTVSARPYSPPRDACCKNRLVTESAAVQSLGYLDAEQRFGLPALIKMDIEGGEKEFLESSAFRSWLRQHNISMLVELHDGYGPDVNLFPWARAQMADPSHLFLDLRFQSDSRTDAPTSKNFG